MAGPGAERRSAGGCGAGGLTEQGAACVCGCLCVRVVLLSVWRKAWVKIGSQMKLGPPGSTSCYIFSLAYFVVCFHEADNEGNAKQVFLFLLSFFNDRMRQQHYQFNHTLLPYLFFACFSIFIHYCFFCFFLSV